MGRRGWDAADGDSYADWDANACRHTYTDAHAHAHTDAHIHNDADDHTDASTDGYPYRCGANGNSNLHSYAHPHADFYAHTDSRARTADDHLDRFPQPDPDRRLANPWDSPVQRSGWGRQLGHL
jgi:hypothetical protein